MEKQFELHEALEFVIDKHLSSYVEGWHNFYITNEQNMIEVGGRQKEDDNSGCLILRLGINYSYREVHISNIFIPLEDRRKGIGFRLIDLIYQISNHYGYALCLVQLTDYFRERMLLRGAIETNDYDSLQIVETTRLN
jgi:ribosomal protein S18 acetylase RimI-like enzyme